MTEVPLYGSTLRGLGVQGVQVYGLGPGGIRDQEGRLRSLELRICRRFRAAFEPFRIFKAHISFVLYQKSFIWTATAMKCVRARDELIARNALINSFEKVSAPAKSSTYSIS